MNNSNSIKNINNIPLEYIDRRRLYTDEDIQHMRELASIGMRTYDIARETGCSYDSVRYYTKQARIESQKAYNKRRAQHFKETRTKEDHRERTQKYLENKRRVKIILEADALLKNRSA